MKMKNFLTILVIILITFPTAQGRRIKRKFDFGASIAVSYIISFGLKTLTKIYKNKKYSEDYKKVYHDLIEDSKNKNDYIKESIKECRKLIRVKDYILTTVNKILTIFSGFETNREEYNHCSQTLSKLIPEVRELNDEEQMKRNLECIESELKSYFKTIIVGIAKLVGTETESSCEREILPIFDAYNDLMKKKKEALKEIKGKLKNSLNLFKIWNTNYGEMGNKAKFGSDKSPEKIKSKNISNFLKGWMGVIIEGGIAVSENIAAYRSQTDTDSSTIPLIVFEALDGLANLSKIPLISNYLNKFSFSSLTSSFLESKVLANNKSHLSIKRASTISYLKKHLILLNIHKFGQIPTELERLKINQNSMSEISLIKDVDPSIEFRQIATHNLKLDYKQKHEIFGLYFVDIEVAYNSKEINLLSKNGFELVSWFTYDHNYDLFVLGRRNNNRKKVVVHFEHIPFDTAEVKTEEIGSDYKIVAANKFRPLIRNKLVSYYTYYCNNIDTAISNIHDLVNMGEIEVKITQKHFLVSLMVDRNIYDKEEYQDYVNCFNKYKKFNDSNKFKVCNVENDRILHLCGRTEKTSEFPYLSKEALVLSDNVYNLFPIKEEKILDRSDIKIQTMEEYRIEYYSEVTYFERENDKIIPKILCLEVKRFNIIDKFRKTFYEEISMDGLNTSKLLDSLEVTLETQNKMIFNKIYRKNKSLNSDLNKFSIKYKDLVVKDEVKNIYIPITDFVQIVMHSDLNIEDDLDIRNDNHMTFRPISNFLNFPFEKIFTGFYHNNNKCMYYSRLIEGAYLSPFLRKADWGLNETLAEAFKVNFDYTKTNLVYPNYEQDDFEIFDRIKLNIETINNKRTISNRQTYKNLNEILNHELEKCNFASLAVWAEFSNTKIENPKVIIYPHERGIQVKLVENSDEELIYKNEIAITFTLVDVAESNNEDSKFNKFNPIYNAERKYNAFGYVKVQDFDGESDFKVYFENEKKFIIVSVWSKIDFNKIQEKTKEIEKICDKEPFLVSKKKSSTNLSGLIEEDPNKIFASKENKSNKTSGLLRHNLSMNFNEPKNNSDNFLVSGANLLHSISPTKKHNLSMNFNEPKNNSDNFFVSGGDDLDVISRKREHNMHKNSSPRTNIQTIHLNAKKHIANKASNSRDNSFDEASNSRDNSFDEASNSRKGDLNRVKKDEKKYLNQIYSPNQSNQNPSFSPKKYNKTNKGRYIERKPTDKKKQQRMISIKDVQSFDENKKLDDEQESNNQAKEKSLPKNSQGRY